MNAYATRACALFVSLLLAACAADTDPDRPSVETVTPEDWNAALAFAQEHDTVYAARLTRLDALTTDGSSRPVAGITYADCPNEQQRWGPLFYEGGYPSFVVDRGAAFFAKPFCGLWSVDLATLS